MFKMFYWSPNQHGIIIKCQLHRDITATAATVTLRVHQMATIAKGRGRHSDQYGRLSNIAQAPQRQHAGITCHGAWTLQRPRADKIFPNTIFKMLTHLIVNNLKSMVSVKSP